MVTGTFTLLGSFATRFGEGTEARFYAFEFFAKVASRGDARNEIRPQKTTQIRAVLCFGKPCSVEMPLVHSTVDNTTW